MLFHVLLICFYAGASFASELCVKIIDPPTRDQHGKTALVPTEHSFELVNVEKVMSQRSPYFDTLKDTRFELYTRLNRVEPQYINVSDVHSLTSSLFNPDHPTRIVIHGWRAIGEMFDMFSDGECSGISKL